MGKIAVSLLLLLQCACAQAEVLTLEKLKTLSTELRAGDDRVVRPNPEDETAKLQNKICPVAIPSVVESLVHSTDFSVRAHPAQVLHLCTTNNPSNRA